MSWTSLTRSFLGGGSALRPADGSSARESAIWTSLRVLVPVAFFATTAFAIAFGPSTAFAGFILIASAPTTTGNSANSLTGTATTGKLQNSSSIALTDSGDSVASTVGAIVDAKVRYEYVTMADADNNTSVSKTVTSAWQLSFTMQADAGDVYSLAINTKRLGALTSVNDSGATLGYAQADLGAMTGTYTGPGTVAGSLNSPAQSFTTGPVTPGQVVSGENSAINQSSTLTVTNIVGTGAPQAFTLTFTWSSFVQSAGFAGVGGIGGYSADEGAIRMGSSTTVGGSTAGVYPGVGSRIAADDGHFVTITGTLVSVVPEPSSLALGGVALVGLIGVAIRRRKAPR